MKFLLSLMVITLSFASLAKKISVSNTDISFVSPYEFRPLSQDIIDTKWPQKRAPKWVLGNASASTTITYDLKPNDISAAHLPVIMDSFKEIFDRMIPGVEWKKKEIIELSGKKWVYLEMFSNAIDTEIHNIMLITSYGKEMLIFNFNSAKGEFPKYEDKLRASIQSIQLSK
ncbi:hypothetical protein [Moritella sp. JT01]|uniref:hypothetical protein n=1 Tax=Moritella sp. JT01 TaxID=756698 RepID=UPI00082E25E9|nr:hypothetical protein [Moritella sp. JT01]